MNTSLGDANTLRGKSLCYSRSAMRRRRWVAISHRFLHFTAHGGYDRLLDYVRCEAIYESRLNRLLSIGGRLRRVYSKANALTDVELLFRAVFGPSSLFHVLYPENTMRLLPLMRSHKHRIIVTVHQPPGRYEGWLEKRGLMRGYMGMLFAGVDGVITLAHSQRPPFERSLCPNRVWTIPHGIDVECFLPNRT